ncbi:MAG: hypothetical protein GC161_15985 [Planctomycetaceae bacterium]|nr:hypothetical protein [Planctomycetaceae bacterium]
MKRRRRILRSLDLAEVSAVDRPAQEGAGAILRKSNTMNTQDIVKEAVGVHVDGQEPRYKADEYEAALLAIARMEQKPSENVVDAMARVASNGNPDVTALLFAADRVRARDAASVGKSNTMNDNLSAILSEADRVSKGAPPTVTRDAAEAAMLDLAKREARPGESVAVSFARLCESDARMQKLYDLGHAADVAEERVALAKGASGDERFDRLLVDMARLRKRAGETVEQCASRLLHEDATIRDAYAAVHGC